MIKILLALISQVSSQDNKYVSTVFQLAKNAVKALENADHLKGSEKRQEAYVRIESILNDNNEQVVAHIVNFCIELAVLIK